MGVAKAISSNEVGVIVDLVIPFFGGLVSTRCS